MSTPAPLCNTELEKRILAPHLDEYVKDYEVRYPNPDPTSFFHKEHQEIARAIISVRESSRPSADLVDSWIERNTRARISTSRQIHEICIKQTTPDLYQSDIAELQNLAAIRDGYDSLNETLTATDNRTKASTLAEQLNEIAERVQSYEPRGRGYRTLGELLERTRNPEDELFLHRYICRGGGLLLIGTTGQGKSSLINQGAQFWAAGNDFMGIRPAKPLKILIFNGENDDDDTQDFCEGISQFGFTEQQQGVVKGNVHYAEARSVSGDGFVAELKRLLAQGRYDLVIVDPAFSFFGGAAADQAEVTGFLRNKINPLLDKFRCGIVIVAHTAKPKTDSQTTDAAYMAFGSVEWANWARAILNLERIGDGVFKLRASKRGGRLNWIDVSGNYTLERGLKWSRGKGQFIWEEAGDGEVQKAIEKRQKRMPSWQEALGIFPQSLGDRDGRLTTKEVKQAFTRTGWDKDTYKEVVDDLLERGELIGLRTGRSNGMAYMRASLHENQTSTSNTASAIKLSSACAGQPETTSRLTELSLG
ncbi:MAG: AAA family ATPase [Candidatus Pacebacteria bacterium]|nr:AAA family ATPase [Candidatus Paceibacterota bacterium]